LCELSEDGGPGLIESDEVPDPTLWGLFLIASLVLLLTPRPAVLYIVARSVQHGRTTGLVSVVGIHAGTIVHIAAAAIGISALVVSSALAFAVVKYLGAAYLIWMGIRTFLTRDFAAEAPTPGKSSLSRAFRDGFVVNLFNPKTAIFFLAFLPQFIDPARGAVHWQIMVLGLTFMALGILTDGMFAFLAGALGELLRGQQSFRRFLRWFSGTSFLGLGVTAALAARN
jgi:threonine/homoserine/homoserine lactone efflux protein